MKPVNDARNNFDIDSLRVASEHGDCDASVRLGQLLLQRGGFGSGFLVGQGMVDQDLKIGKFLPLHEHLEFLGVQGFPFQQGGGQGLDLIFVGFQAGGTPGRALVDGAVSYDNLGVGDLMTAQTISFATAGQTSTSGNLMANSYVGIQRDRKSVV